jgi:hypothetical protein
MLLRRTLQTGAFALLLVPAVASAQGSDADRTAARALAREGRAALDRRDFATAADRLQRAEALAHAPTIALDLARAQVGLGRWLAARDTYARIVHEGVLAGAPPAARKAVADAQTEGSVLETRIPLMVIQVQGPGAVAAKGTLDGAPLPSGSHSVYRLVDPGTHTVRVDADGFAPAQTSVTMPEHHSEIVTLTLDHPLAPAASSKLAIPASVVPPPPDEAPLPPAHESNVRGTVGFVLIDVGAAGLVVGAVAAGIAAGKHDAGSSGSSHAMVAVSVVGFVAGGALVATGAVLCATASTREPAKAAWVAPFVGAGRAGIVGGF